MPVFGASPRRPEHPYLVSELTDLPAGLRRLVEPQVEHDAVIERIFVVPAQVFSKEFEGRAGVRRVPQQAMVFTGDGIVYARWADHPMPTGWAAALKGKDLLFAQLSVILLYGRLELCAAVGGELRQIVLEYNSVSQPQLQPALWRLLRMAWEMPVQTKDGVDRTEGYLEEIQELSLKYGNGMHLFGLQPDERLLGFAYQPPIYQRSLKFLRRKIAPPALLAITSHQVITMEEGLTKVASYGWIVSFYAHNRIRSIEIAPIEQRREIVFHLAKDAAEIDRRVVAESDAAEEWRRQWAVVSG